MNDDQCNVIVKAIKELTSAVHAVGEKIEENCCYYDGDLRKEVHLIAEILEDIKDDKLKDVDYHCE